MNAAEIKLELSKMGVRPNRRLGQNFLIDNNILKTIINAADIRKGDQVLEIGPGLGVLTSALADQGAQVIAIEKDRRFADYLVGAIHELSVRIIQGDAVTLHWHELIGDRPWKFVSNLPYQITSFALRKALWAPKPPDVVVALVQ
ncbi:16S rRNA (adenine(1518)-N(6)/adenine(1519)-N(6))-dimethyltransferase, partial [Patescibacteria group bacterium]|nr:16S rRNA (adenine(1518)-N(6)/adenine(1519)-N(6))-dimethyltransferase [Patescibacteria group bacterium]